MKKKPPNNTSNQNHNDPRDTNDDSIIYFPSLEKQKTRTKANPQKKNKNLETEEEKWREAYKQQQLKEKQASNTTEPFFNFGNIPTFTKTLTAIILFINIPLMFLKLINTSPETLYTLSYKFGFVPARFTSAGLDVLAIATPFTHALFHGDWVHLAFNTIMLVALGTLMERIYGTRTTLVFFTLCVLAGAATFFALSPFADTPMIGASGGISGLFAAALMIMHDQKSNMIGFHKHSKYGPWPLVIGWLFLMLLIGTFSGANVAWQAHIGGYVTGAILYALIKKGKLNL